MIAAGSSPVELAAVVDIQTAAQILKIGVRTIERLEAAGVFPVARIAGLGAGAKRRRRLYSRAELLRWVERNGARR